MTIFQKFWNLFKLLNKGFGAYRKQIAAMAFFSAFSSLLDGVGINSIIPLFSLIDNQQASASDLVSRILQRFFAYAHLPYTVSYFLGFIAFLFVLKAVMSLAGQYIVARTAANYEKNKRIELFQALLASSWPYLSRQKLGNLDQILITDLGYVTGLFSHLSFSFFIVVNFLVYSFLVWNISSLVAALAFAFGILVLIFFKPLFSKTKRAAADTGSRYKELSHFINENILNMKAIKSFSVEMAVYQKGLDYFNQLKKLRMKSELLYGFTSVILQPVGIFFIIGAFIFLYKTASFQIASFAVIVYAINKVFVNIQAIQSEAHLLNSRIPYLNTTLGYQDEALAYKEEDKGRQPFVFNHKFELQHVAFAYGSGQLVLEDVNFAVSEGEMVGLVGASGVGKTTIVDLLLRLLKPQKGDLLLDGRSVEEISLKEWRINIGYVSQDIFLINVTILNNIKFYKDSLDMEDVVEAAQMANIYDFIKNLPQQFETIVGERGVRLSGGEKQRLVLARVLVRKPKILILDEATSALDNESEMLIQKSIEALRGKVTIIAIAHRLSTILDFDKVLVLDSGKIIEQGTPRELLKDVNSKFYKIYNLKR